MWNQIKLVIDKKDRECEKCKNSFLSWSSVFSLAPWSGSDISEKTQWMEPDLELKNAGKSCFDHLVL